LKGRVPKKRRSEEKRQKTTLREEKREIIRGNDLWDWSKGVLTDSDAGRPRLKKVEKDCSRGRRSGGGLS